MAAPVVGDPAPQVHAPLLHPKYRPDIDGLRAVAVLSVLGFHAFPMWVRGGFIGVDIFFVISGFLISTIIYGSMDATGFDYGRFYERRIRRIFPALVLVLAMSLVFGWYLLLPGEWEQLGKHAAAGAAFVSNFAFWQEAGYFDNLAETKPLLHLWSLAIEEQFYILWPLLLAFAWRRKGRSLRIVGTVGALSFLLNVATVHGHATAAFYSPLSRFWELFLGGLLAFYRAYRPGVLTKRPNLQSVAGLGLIVFGLCFVRSNMAFPGWWALPPTLGAFFCISAGPNAVLNRTLLAARPMVWIGLISYPLYLWHWPLLVFARILEGRSPSTELRAGMLLLAALLAYLTYRFYERPARQGRGGRTVWILSGSMVVIALVGLAAATGRLHVRHDDAYFDKVSAAARDWSYPDGMAPVEVAGELMYRLGSGPHRVLFFGDSHVEQYGARAAELAKRSPGAVNTMLFATWGACPPILQVTDESNYRCAPRRDTVMRYAMGSEVDAVVLGGCWNCYLLHDKADPKDEAADHYVYLEGGARRRFMGGGGVDLALGMLEQEIRALVAAHKRVFLLLDNPIGEDFEPANFVKNRWGALSSVRMTPKAPLPADQKALNDRLRGIAERAGAVVIDPSAGLCEGGECLRAWPDGTPIYKDAVHLRAAFVRDSATWLDPAVDSAKW